MAAAALHLTWTILDAGTEYFLDGRSLGMDAQGVEALLAEIARREDIQSLVVEGPPAGDVTGGKSVTETFPFYPWYDELTSLLRSRDITLEVAPAM